MLSACENELLNSQYSCAMMHGFMFRVLLYGALDSSLGIQCRTDFVNIPHRRFHLR